MMKPRTVRYLTFEGIKNLWANRLMTVASIGVLVACMVIIGLATLLTMNVNVAMSSLEQENVIMAYFNDKNSVLYGSESDKFVSSITTESNSGESAESNSDSSEAGESASSTINLDVPEEAYLIHNEEEALALCEVLETIDNVANVEYISSEEGLNALKENRFGGQEELFSFFDSYGNPLQSGARITLNDMSYFDDTLKAISETPGVSTTQSFSELAKKIDAIKNGVSIAGFWIIAILLIISLVIVSNTIRVTMYTRKLEIGIMKAVGATNSFIRLPFVIEGIAIGFISSLISMGLVYFCYRIVGDTIATSLGTIQIVPFGDAFIQLFVSSLIIGTFSGLVGSFIMISKYLRKEGSEFTAI